ncbi:hypothetical protein CRM75_01190 [Enterococcus faecium]|nr:hypothetical protein CRM75_01190 [Enterococcus faecium]
MADYLSKIGFVSVRSDKNDLSDILFSAEKEILNRFDSMKTPIDYKLGASYTHYNMTPYLFL